MGYRNLLSATALVGVLATLPATAYAKADDAPQTATATAAAQDAAQPAPAAQDTNGDESTQVVVTGSRIARTTLDSPAPITQVTANELFNRGQISVGDALNDLPQLRSTFSQSNSTRFIGTSGENILDLRGLGTARTLVLVNGRRHVTAVPGTLQVDVNTIPPELVESVDIVTGGTSSIYGSDALAGVVNFKLRDNFEGFRASGQGGISYLGDRGNYFGALTYGRNFSGGRGNIAVSGEFSHASPVFNIDRPEFTGAFTGRSQFNLAENINGEPQAGNGIPDNQFFSGVRNGTIFDGGGLNAVCGDANVADITRCRASSASASSTSATNRFTSSRGQRYAFLPNGTLVLSNPSLDFRDITNNGSSNTVGGLGSTLRNTGQLLPLNERYSFNLLSHYDFSDLVQFFFEGKYVHYRVNQEGQPSFSTGFGALTNNVNCSNAFLRADALATLQSIGFCANPATGVFPINRFNVDFGGRGELQERETYRFVGGFRGTFNNNWKYELAFNYGHYSSFLRSLNNLVLTDINGNPDGFLLAANAVNAPAGYTGTNFELGPTGNRVICAVNATAAGNVRPDCVPINQFGVGAPSQAALNFVNTTATRAQRATEIDATLNISGDLRQLFELPGGPVRFAVGAEYRSETSFSAFDPLTQAGATFLNAIPTFLPPAQTVTEGYGEVELPILKNVPFIEELTLSGAGRYSSYNGGGGNTGGVFSYNAGLIWAPTREFRFRGSYAVAVRAPTQGDLFTSPTQNFNFVTDPCDVQNINNGTTFRVANCAALGVPAGFVNLPFRQQSQSFFNAGNPNLEAETSKSFTIGTVLEPRIARGLSLTLDYYNIEVTNLIAGLGLQTILNLCVDSPTLNNQFCPLLSPRDPATGLFPQNVGVSAGVNFAKQRTSGIDVDLRYRHDFGGITAQVRTLFTYIFERSNFTSPTNPDFAVAQLGNLGDPQVEGQFSLDLRTKSGWSVSYNVQYIGVQSITAFENTHTFQGRAPQNPDILPFGNYPDVTYHAIRIGKEVNKKYEFYFGVDNLFNRLPPFGLLGTGGGDAIFPNTGRFFYSGFKIKLGQNFR